MLGLLPRRAPMKQLTETVVCRRALSSAFNVSPWRKRGSGALLRTLPRLRAPFNPDEFLRLSSGPLDGLSTTKIFRRRKLKNHKMERPVVQLPAALAC